MIVEECVEHVMSRVFGGEQHIHLLADSTYLETSKEREYTQTLRQLRRQYTQTLGITHTTFNKPSKYKYRL